MPQRLLPAPGHHFVFVYGTLKAGYGNHRYLHGSRFICNALTLTRYRMWCIGFPLIQRDDRAGHPVAGEVYDITPRTMADLDALEANGRMYRRATRDLRSHDGLLSAYLYEWLGHPQGDPVRPNAEGVILWSPT